MSPLAMESASAQATRVQKISATEGGFTGVLRDGGGFGTQITALGDVDGDGVVDLAVGAPGGIPPTFDLRGSVWILFLSQDGTVKRQVELPVPDPDSGGEFAIGLADGFGAGLGALGDLDGDNVSELAVSSRAVTYLQLLNPDGTPKPHPTHYLLDHFTHHTVVFDARDKLAARVSRDLFLPVRILRWLPGTGEPTELGPSRFPTDLQRLWAGFGSSVAQIDLKSEPALVVGAPKARTDRYESGTVALLQFDIIRRGEAVGVVRYRSSRSIDETSASPIDLRSGDWFGTSVANAGDLNGDGLPDLVVGAPGDDDGGPERGALWVLFLDAEGQVLWHDKLSSQTRSDLSKLTDDSRFGTSIASLGDLNGDGYNDLAVGAPRDDDGGDNRGAIYILFDLDEFRPGIALSSTPPDPSPTGTALKVEADVYKGVSPPSSVELIFKRGGEEEGFAAEMTESYPGHYSGSIPGFAVTERGVEFYVRARSGTGLESRLPASRTIPVRIRLPDGLSLEAPVGSAANQYRLVSIPMVLDQPSASSVLLDDLGPYDPTVWRFFGSLRRNELTEFGDDSLYFQPGRAFWLIAKNRQSPIHTGPATSIPTDRPFEIPVRRGWNLVANPFAFQVPVSNVTLRSGGPTELLAYKGAWEPLSSTLDPFSGYAVFVPAGDTLLVDPNVRQQVSGKRLEAERSADLDTETDWAIRISGRRGTARDDYNLLGVSAAASDGWDEMDRPEPPAVWDYVSVYFKHEEWAQESSLFRTDIKSAQCAVRGAVDGTACSWTVGVSAANAGSVELSFDGIDSVPAEFALWLHDPASGVWQDLRLDNRFAVVVAGTPPSRDGSPTSGSARTLEIVARPANDRPARQQPATELELSSFPNPFSRTVTIAYGLPEDADVSLSVFNILGQRVARLTDAGFKAAGRHVAIWDAVSDDGQPLAPGMYIVRLEAGGATRSTVVTLAN